MSAIPAKQNVTYTAYPHTDGYEDTDHIITWIFSDGSTGTGRSIVKKWMTPGHYVATARAVNIYTKKWAIATCHANVDFTEPGDIIVEVSVPGSVNMGNSFDISATATRDINPKNGYSYNWHFEGTVMDMDALGAENTLMSPYAQTYNWTLTVTDLDRMDSAQVTGTLIIESVIIWGYTSAAPVSLESSGLYVASDGWIYYKNSNNLYKYLPFDPDTHTLVYTAPLVGNESVNNQILGSKDKIIFTSRQILTTTYDGSSQSVDKYIHYYYVYDTATGTCQKRQLSELFHDYYQWYPGNLGPITDISEPQYVRYSMWAENTTQYESYIPRIVGLTLLDDDTIDICLYKGQTDFIYTDNDPIGSHGNEDSWWGRRNHKCGHHFKYHIDDDFLYSPVNDQTGYGVDVFAHNGHVTYFNYGQYITGSLKLGIIATSDIDGSYWSRGYNLDDYMGGTPNDLLGGSQGSSWYIGTKIPIPNDNRFFIFVFADDPNTAPYSETFYKCFLVDPTTNDLMTEWTDYEITNIPVRESPYTPGQFSYPVYRMQNIQWNVINGCTVGFHNNVSLNAFPFENQYLFSAIVDPNTLHLNVCSLDKTIYCNPYNTSPHGRTTNWVYHPKLDRIFTSSGSIHAFTKQAFPMIPYNTPTTYPTIDITFPATITGDNTLASNTTKVYYCSNSYTQYTPGLRCEWSVVGKATLLTPSAVQIKNNAPEFTIKLKTNADFQVGDTITLQARIYTHGGEVIKTKSIAFADPMAYYEPITNLAYGETVYVGVPASTQTNPEDPTRYRMCKMIRFQGTINDNVTMQAIAQGSNWDTYIILYNSNMQLIASDDDGAGSYNSRISNRTLTYTGTYYLSIMGYSDRSYVRYANVTLTKNN